jgi:SAM-dependent methyltransferase
VTPTPPRDGDASVLVDSKGNGFRMRPAHCPTCGPGPVRVVGLRGGRHQRHGRGVETRIVCCRTCRLLFPDPFPFPVDPQELYGDPQKYFEGHDEQGKVDTGRSIVRRASQRLGAPVRSLLDVGSGRGEVVAAAQLEGVTTVVGLEFSKAMIDYASRKYGATILPQTVEEHAAARPAPVYDCVVLNAVIEHVYDPDAFVAAVAAVTRPGGVVYVDTPRDPNLLTWIGNAWFAATLRRTVLNLAPTWPPYHVYGFSPRSLDVLLRKHGLRIDDLQVHARAHIPHDGRLADRAKSLVGEQVMRLANLTGTASNMIAWARRA